MIDVMQLFEADEKTAASRQVAISATEGICFEVDRNVLKVLLEKAIEVVPSKDMYPVLKNFQFRVRGDKLSVIASDMDMTIITATSMSVETKVGGIEVFPARKLLEIVRESDAGCRIYIEVIGRRAIIVAGTASWEIALSKNTDFPKQPKLGEAVLQEADRSEFLRAVSTVKYATHPTRPDLRIVQIRGGRFTACDGTRLQQAKIDGLSLDMQVPNSAIDTLIKLLKGSDLEKVYVGELDNRLVFRVGTDHLLVKKREVRFPEVDQLWLRPALAHDQKLQVDRNQLIAALRKAKINMDAEYSCVVLYLTPGSDDAHKGEMTVFAASDEGGSATETVPILWGGPKRELIVHYKYLRDLLSHCAAEECLFMLGNDQQSRRSPILLRDTENGSLGIVQQMLGVPTRLMRTPDRR